MSLKAIVVEISSLMEQDIAVMCALMDEYYENIKPEIFQKDLKDKHYCILLVDEKGIIKGFSTQKIIHFNVKGEKIHGVFSGDTIIHKKNRGSLELYKSFASFFLEMGRNIDHFYWFLISKGYKTYKILPLFFNEFYPRFRTQTPACEQSIINAFGHLYYPGEFNEDSGVISYRGVKDKLKKGVADITDKHLKDEDTAYFTQINPGHAKGNDLVCVARLAEDNLKPTAQRLLLGRR